MPASCSLFLTNLRTKVPMQIFNSQAQVYKQINCALVIEDTIEDFLFTVEPPLTAYTLHNGHFFWADSPHINSYLNISTMATFFCP